MAEYMAGLEGKQELSERLSLMEAMIAEGRRTTARWGWSWVLWGVAYFVAIAWSNQSGWRNAGLAWGVTMTIAGAITAFFARRMMGRGVQTTLSRSMAAIWRALGISLYVFCFCAGISGHAEQHVMIAAICTMLGMVNASSSMILRWKAQFAVAVVWWAAAVASLFGSVEQSRDAFLLAIFLCQIVFGAYMMLLESRGNRVGMSHA